jgi:hypothetical protein
MTDQEWPAPKPVETTEAAIRRVLPGAHWAPLREKVIAHELRKPIDNADGNV